MDDKYLTSFGSFVIEQLKQMSIPERQEFFERLLEEFCPDCYGKVCESETRENIMKSQEIWRRRE